MSKSAAAAYFNVFTVREFDGSTGQKAKSWTKVGVAFPTPRRVRVSTWSWRRCRWTAAWSRWFPTKKTSARRRVDSLLPTDQSRSHKKRPAEAGLFIDQVDDRVFTSPPEQTKSQPCASWQHGASWHES